MNTGALLKYLITGMLICIISASVTGCTTGPGSPSAIPDRTSAGAEYTGLMPLFGDPHVHTNLSDGDESPDFAVRYGRDVTKLDWLCLTDHSELMAFDGWLGLDYYKSIPAKYNEDGKFSVLFGYEWSSQVNGHRCVYSPTPDIPVLSCTDAASSRIRKLWEELKGYNAITVPHHPLLPTKRHWWEFSNPAMEPCVEFYSKWGNALGWPAVDRKPHIFTDENFIFKAMAEQGLRLGMMAGTDTHLSRPGSILGESRPDGTLEYERPGLTAVWAVAHTREAIFDAIKNRHCYGVTGTRAIVEFSVNGSIMGSDITAESSPEIKFSTSTPESSLKKISVVKIHDGQVELVASFDVSGINYAGSWTDQQFNSDSAYLLVVDLENTDIAVTSPVWVERVTSLSAVY